MAILGFAIAFGMNLAASALASLCKAGRVHITRQVLYLPFLHALVGQFFFWAVRLNVVGLYLTFFQVFYTFMFICLELLSQQIDDLSTFDVAIMALFTRLSRDKAWRRTARGFRIVVGVFSFGLIVLTIAVGWRMNWRLIVDRDCGFA